ncbi:hypothetical protein [Jiangella alkaliphila]|uniref:Uncharacterized protein n=1 Tax=Jiangella alkaliphila TaxID=419479 RepID=A0A1H2KE20_9ACTN|nr:hypothetical protein [Jiangella alkaliphila]SDU66852.1 hypothetical protein SAMN04488563_3721 [Jiangella alkaliphila]
MRELTDDGGSGDAQVDEAVRTLEALDGLPVHEHAPLIERAHQVLQDRLSGEPDAPFDGESDAPATEEYDAEAGEFDDAAAGDDLGGPSSPGGPSSLGGAADDVGDRGAGEGEG